jgi:hypothetical protein
LSTGRDHDLHKLGEEKFMKVTDLIATSAFVASFAFAASALAGETDQFTQLDTDGNGMISSEEAAADPTLVESWTAVDVNQDGQLERAEFSALEEKSTSEMAK